MSGLNRVLFVEDLKFNVYRFMIGRIGTVDIVIHNLKVEDFYISFG